MTYSLLQKWLGYLFLCFAGVIVTITLISVIWDYRDIEDKAIKNLKTASFAVESELNSELVKYDKRLTVLIDQIIKSPPQKLQESSEVLLYWRRFAQIYNQVDADYFFMSPNGSTTRFLQKDPKMNLNLQSFEFIQDRLQSNDLNITIGKSIKNPWNQSQQVLPLTRKVYRGKKYIGIVGSLVPIEFYSKFIQKLELPQNSVTALLHTDEGFLAVYPEDDIKKNNLSAYSDILAQEIKKNTKGTFVDKNTENSSEDLVFYSHIGDTPLYVVITRDYDEIFSTWKDGLWLRVIITLLTFVFLAYIYYVMNRQIFHIEEQDKKNAEYNRQLRQLIQITSRVTGEEFFKTLSKQFHDTTGFRYICISKVLDMEPGKVRTLVFTDNGSMLENLTYDVKNTPCEATLKNGLLLYSSNLQEIFPEDEYLKDTNIESYVGAPLKDSQGKILGIIAVLDEKPMKNPDMIRSLLMIFASRAGAEMERIENEKIRKQLAQTQFQYNKMESLGRLAGGMAHDFNNILMMLFGNMDRIKGDLPADSPAIRYLDKMELGALRAKGIVQQILTFSRKQEPKKETVDVRKNLEEVCSLFSEIIPSNIDLELHLEDNPYVLGDATQFHQILTNICSNSIYAMREGRGSLKIQMSKIDLTDADLGIESMDLQVRKYVKIQITDTGKGIDKEDLEKIFDPFYTTKPIGEGTGLGLSVVHGILQAWNGHIKVDSSVEQGTSTCIFLPELMIENSPLKDAPEAAEVSMLGKTALVVDDEEDLVELICFQLKQKGIRTKGFTKSKDALVEFQKNFSEYDFIISDISMPEMDGIQLYNKVQEVRRTPVIFTTGNSLSLNLKFQFMQDVRILEKPYQFKELTKTIDSLV